MEWRQIRQWAEKYWKADSSIDEERQLRKHIISSDDPQRDPQEVEYFKTLEQFSSLQLDEEFDDRFFSRIAKTSPKQKFPDQRWLAWAASVVLAFGIIGGIGYNYHQKQLARKQEAREAFEIAKNALFMVSEKMNKGSQYAVDGLRKFEETHQKIKVQNYNN